MINFKIIIIYLSVGNLLVSQEFVYVFLGIQTMHFLYVATLQIMCRIKGKQKIRVLRKKPTNTSGCLSADCVHIFTIFTLVNFSLITVMLHRMTGPLLEEIGLRGISC